MAPAGDTEDHGKQGSAIGDRVRSARERRGWNREALAFHSGVSWAGVSQVESGRRTNLRPATLSALATALGVSVDYLVSGRASVPPMLEHRALLYESEDEFCTSIVPFLGEAIERRERALVVSSERNNELLRERLGPLAGDVEFVERSTWYRAPESTLEAYQSFVEGAVDAGGTWVRIVGEVVWEGLSDPLVCTWGRYESLLNLALASAPATIVCPYDARSLAPEIIDVARATHPHLIAGEALSSNPSYSRLSGLLDDR
ncbi:MAG TPA: MEDS domain-containing protein [Solirubrobacteraceae bacterium]|nr:MEDS domain-containing protein [Solirubrobacteraceae bacterium]